MGDKGPLILGVCWLLAALVVITIAARILVRINAHQVGADDYFMLVAGV
jgi:hypothetical protein